MIDGKYEYFAFISYRWEDEKMAKWLQEKLEHYKLPTSLREQNPNLPTHIRPVFRDKTDLNGHTLEESLMSALESSRYLIVICSPLATQSEWVNRGIQKFIDLGREKDIIPFIIDGEANADDPKNECFPPALRSLKGERAIYGININDNGRDAAAVKVVSRMFDVKYDTLWNRFLLEQKKRRRYTIAGLVAAILIVVGVAGYIWMQSREIESQYKELQAKNAQIEQQNKDLDEKSDSIQAANDSIKRAYERLDLSEKNLSRSNAELSKSRDSIILTNSLLVSRNKELAEANWNILENLYKLETEKALKFRENGDLYSAIKICLECLPLDDSSDKVPVIPEMVRLFRECSYTLLCESNECVGNVTTCKYHYNDEMDYGITPSEKYVWINMDDTLSIYDIKNMNLLHRKIPVGASCDPNCFSTKLDVYVTDYSIEQEEQLGWRKMHMETGIGRQRNSMHVRVEPGISITMTDPNGDCKTVFSSIDKREEEMRRIVVWNIEDGDSIKVGPFSKDVKNTQFMSNGGLASTNPFSRIAIIDTLSLTRQYDIPIYGDYVLKQGRYAIESDSYYVRMADLSNKDHYYEHQICNKECESIQCEYSTEELWVIVISNDTTQDKQIQIREIASGDIIKEFNNLSIPISKVLMTENNNTILLLNSEGDNTQLTIIGSNGYLSDTYTLPIEYSDLKFNKDNSELLLYNKDKHEFYSFNISALELSYCSMSDYFYDKQYYIERDKETTIAKLYSLSNQANFIGKNHNYIVTAFEYDNDTIFYNHDGKKYYPTDVEVASFEEFLVHEKDGGYYIFNPKNKINTKIDFGAGCDKSRDFDIASNELLDFSVFAGSGDIYFVDNKSGNIIKQNKIQGESFENTLLCSNGNIMYSKVNGEDYIYNLTNNNSFVKLQKEISHNPLLSNDGRYFAAYLENDALGVFNCQDGGLCWENGNAYTSNGGNMICFNEDASIIACVSDGNIVYAFDVKTGNVIHKFEFLEDVTCIDLSDSLLLCGLKNGEIKILDVSKKRIVQTIQNICTGPVWWSMTKNNVIECFSGEIIASIPYIPTKNLALRMNEKFNGNRNGRKCVK